MNFLNIKKLLKMGVISPKKKALINYFRISNSCGENYDINAIIDFKNDDNIYDSEEFEMLTSPSGKDNIEVDKWNNIISLIVRIDIVAEKYYYQTTSEIFFDTISTSIKQQHLHIHDYYFNYLFNTFSVLLLNQIFFNVIKLESPNLLSNIPLIEKYVHEDVCFLFIDEYIFKKSEVIKRAREPVNQITNIMKEYEFISENLMKSFIDKADNLILKSFGLT